MQYIFFETISTCIQIPTLVIYQIKVLLLLILNLILSKCLLGVLPKICSLANRLHEWRLLKLKTLNVLT